MAALCDALLAQLQTGREVDAAVDAIVNIIYNGGMLALVEDMSHPDPLRYCRALRAVPGLKKKLGKAFDERADAAGLSKAWLVAFDRAFDFDPATRRCRAIERGENIIWPRREKDI